MSAVHSLKQKQQEEPTYGLTLCMLSGTYSMANMFKIAYLSMSMPYNVAKMLDLCFASA